MINIQFLLKKYPWIKRILAFRSNFFRKKCVLYAGIYGNHNTVGLNSFQFSGQTGYYSAKLT